MEHVRIGPEVVRSDGPLVQRLIRLKSENEVPAEPPMLGSETAMPVNVAFAAGVAILLMWANGRLSAWFATGLLVALAAGVGTWLARRTLTQIEAQEQALAAARAEQARLTALNTELRGQIDQAHRRGAEINERSLRRIGADLHDGPAQLLGLVLLKLDELTPHLPATSDGGRPGHETLELIRRATSEALDEIRNTARGLVLPDIEQVTLAAALELAIRSHEKRTHTSVDAGIGLLPAHVPLPVTISLFRFVQEGLNNAFRHAGGRGQSLKATYEDDVITVEVADSGPGFDATNLEARKDRLGLAGLRQRLQSLGGTLEICSILGQGTRLVAQFPHAATF